MQLDDVLYEALHRLLYQREAGLVVPLVTCLASLLSKVESSVTQKLEVGQVKCIIVGIVCLYVFNVMYTVHRWVG
jgi:hypothetical protein